MLGFSYMTCLLNATILEDGVFLISCIGLHNHENNQAIL